MKLDISYLYFFFNLRYFLRLSRHKFDLFVWIMPLRCRHAIKKPLSLYDQDKLRKNEPIHLTNSALISEPQFESWAPVKAREQRQSSAGHPSLHRIPREHHRSH